MNLNIHTGEEKKDLIEKQIETATSHRGLDSYHFSGFRRGPPYAVGIVVQHGVLDHSSEHKQEADSDKQVHGCYVGHPGK